MPTPVEIDRALARLEMAAREHGTAVGIATALPATVDAHRRMGEDGGGRGFVLVPITMVAVEGKVDRNVIRAARTKRVTGMTEQQCPPYEDLCPIGLAPA